MMDQKFSSLTALGCAALTVLAPLSATAKSPHSISVTPVATVAAGSFLTSAAEIAAHDPATQRVFVVNAQAAQIDVISIADPSQPSIIGVIDAKPYGAVANSVAVNDGVIAVAVEAVVKTAPGKVVFFNTNLQFLSEVTVGALPDMVAFTPNGRYVLTADEGEPSDDYTVDPEGTVSIIDTSKGVANVTQADVRTANFQAFNSKSRAELFNGTGGSPKPAIRVFGPNATVAQDLEPEYITVSHDSKTAWVTLQEGNAMGIIDIPTATVQQLVGLGTKDHSLSANGFGSGNALDASDRDGIPVANNGRINIQNWPVRGLYLPDSIASYKVGNQTYLVLANEGDSREWSGYAEETRVGSMALDPAAFPPAVATDLKKT
ncbi:MAG TPA: choice-of-anchor I family protein, partial [Candidatus Saccharimonadia bacterium]|nr:choice-of-anchor I family protein [Candidatus Saccharimonadia bacterium]